MPLERFPRIRGDVVFLEVDSGAYFRSADETILLRGPAAYRLASVVVRALTGEQSLGEIVGELAEEQRQSVLHVVRTLHDKGMVRLGATRRIMEADFDAQLAYVEHFVADDVDSVAAFNRFRDARVLVRGGECVVSITAGLLVNGAKNVTVETDDGSFVASLDEALQAVGAPSGTAGVQVVAPGASPSRPNYIVFDAPLDRMRELARLTAELGATGAGATLVPIIRTNKVATIGPMWRAGQRGCWACAQMRVATNSEGAESAVTRALAFGAPREGNGTPVIAMLGNEAAFAVFRASSRSDVGELERAVLRQDFETLESTLHPVTPDPDCPYCSSSPTSWSSETVDSGPVDLVDAAAAITDPVTGVLSRWTDDEIDQVPLKTGRIEYFVETPCGAERREAVGHDLDDVLAARRGALQRALVHLAGCRPALPAGVDGAVAVPAAALDGVRTDAPVVTGAVVGGRRLSDDERVTVPIEAVIRPALNGAFVRTSLGVEWGATALEATEAAFRSALALRGLEAALRGTARALDYRPAIDDDIDFLVRSLGHLGVAPGLRRLPGAAPTCAVVAFEDGRSDGVWTLGVADDPREATVIALRDLLGAITSRSSAEAVWPTTHPALFAVEEAEDSAQPTRPDWAAVRAEAVVINVTPKDLARLGGRAHRVLLTHPFPVDR